MTTITSQDKNGREKADALLGMIRSEIMQNGSRAFAIEWSKTDGRTAVMIVLEAVPQSAQSEPVAGG